MATETPKVIADGPRVRTFAGGAMRDLDINKPDYEGFLSPRVLEAFGRYMHKHRQMPDGTYRNSDNWQKGIPRDAYMKSLWRHFFDMWKHHRGLAVQESLDDAICGILFNVMGYYHEVLQDEQVKL